MVELAHHQAGLIRAIATRQDRGAFTELFNTFAPKVKSYMMREGCSAELAEDLVIETFVKLWRKAHTFDATRVTVAGWIYTVARNNRIDAFRRERRIEVISLEFDTAPIKSPEDDLLHAERAGLLRNALDELPADLAEILTLSFVHHHTHRQIAAELNLPLGTVKSRIRLAVGRLRRVLRGMDMSSPIALNTGATDHN